MTHENTVIVMKQIFRLYPKRGSFPDLLGDPGGSGIGGYCEMFNLAAVMADDQQDIQHFEIKSRDDQKVHRPNALAVIGQKGLP